jgi:hypothetical protein
MEVYMPGAQLSWDQIEATQYAANKEAGTRFVPGRSIPVPSTVSPSLHTTIAAPCRIPAWDANPKDAAEWKTWNDFCEYEDSLNGAIANQRLAVLCTYPLAVLRRRLLSDLPRQSGKPL